MVTDDEEKQILEIQDRSWCVINSDALIEDQNASIESTGSF